MAYTVPVLCFTHEARRLGTSAISSQNTAHATFGAAFLVDDRIYDGQATFAANATDHHWQLDRAVAVAPFVNVLAVPSGHNWNGRNYRLRGADDAGFTSGVVDLIPETAVTGSALLASTFAFTSKRYLRLDWPNSGAAWNPTLGEWFVSIYLATALAPEKGWKTARRANALVTRYANGRRSVLTQGPNQRGREYVYNDVRAGDRAILAALLDAVGAEGSGLIYLDPEYDSAEFSPGWFCRLEDQDTNENAAAPNTESDLVERFRLELWEALE